MRSFLLLTSTVLIASCGSDHGPAGPSSADPAVSGVASGEALFPLEPGMLWTYTGEIDGVPYDEEVLALDEIVWPGEVGKRFARVVPLVERRYVGGLLVELSTEWFGMDHVGDIYQLGEQSWTLQGGMFVEEPDTWRAGDGDAAVPVPYLPSDPQVGDRIVLHLPHAVEILEVVDTDVTVETPAGVFHHCTEVHEDPSGVDTDIVLYAPGTGIVSEVSSNGYRVLTNVRRR